MIVTIDGPAGSGKSSAAQLLSEKLGVPFLNSGLIFRSLAWVCLELNLPITDPTTCADVAHGLQFEIPGHEQALVSYGSISNQLLTYTELRSHAVDEAVHHIASYAEVRQEIHRLQREIGEDQGCVMEGRTIGTHVFPDADVKFWITADPEIRLARIAAQRGAETASKMLARDEHDATREHEPMVPAEDAIQVDSGKLNPEQVVDLLYNKVREKTA